MRACEHKEGSTGVRIWVESAAHRTYLPAAIMRVLVVGAGLAGLSLALCLERNGHEPIVLEQSPALRGAGYMIDFFGSGYDAAERLGLLPELAARLAVRDAVLRMSASRVGGWILKRQISGDSVIAPA